MYICVCACIIPNIGINNKLFYNFKFHALQTSGE